MGRRLFVGLVVTVMAVAGLCAPAEATARPLKTALIYGDSLVWESTASIELGAGWTKAMHAIFGRAPCDWLAALPTDISTYHPAVVTIATAGNTQGSGSCEQNVGGSETYFDDYRSDLEAIVQQVTATGAQLVFVEDPPFADPTRNADVVQINAMEVALASEYPHVSVYTQIRKKLSTKTGGYEDHARCMSTETAAMGCTDHVIAVRTLPGQVGAGLHLCPDALGPTLPACDTYSSGEVRFGKAIAAATKHPKPIVQ